MNQIITHDRLVSMMNNPSLTACKIGTGYTVQSFCKAVNVILKPYIIDPQEIIDKLSVYTDSEELERIEIRADCERIIVINKQIFSVQINKHNPNAIIETVYVFETSELEDMFKLEYPIKAFSNEDTQSELFRVSNQYLMHKREINTLIFCLSSEMDTAIINMKQMEYLECKTKLKELLLDPVLFKFHKLRYFQNRFNELVGDAFFDRQESARIDVMHRDYKNRFNQLLEMLR